MPMDDRVDIACERFLHFEQSVGRPKVGIQFVVSDSKYGNR
jgi:hypothetical protein